MARRATRDTAIGQRIRDRRTLLKLTLRVAADRAGISHTTLSRIERGEISADNRFTLADIAEALRCPVTDLTGLPAAPADRDQAEAGGAVHEALQAVIGADLDYPPDSEPVALDALGRELELVRGLRIRCDYIAAANRIPNLIRGLHAAAYGQERERALRGLVIAEDMTSFVIRYAGHPGSACLVADRAHQAAERLDDPVMLGLAAWSRGHAATGMGLYPRALQVAQRAATELQPHTGEPDALEMFGQLLMLQAFAIYAQGRDLADTTELVAEAVRIAEQTGESGALNLAFGPTNIRFWKVSMLSDGDPGAAVEIARETQPAAVESPSRQFAFYADTGRALAHLRRDREALRMLLTAERLSPQRMRSPIITETVRGLLERSKRGTGWTELRGLCERLGIGA